MNRTRCTHPRSPRAARAFTLLELMVVVGIVAVLVAITTMVGSAVINTGKKQATLGTIQTLDEALAAFIDKHGDIPPALVEIPAAELPSDIKNDLPASGGVVLSAYYPAVDGRARNIVSGGLQVVNSVGLFIHSARTVPETRDILDNINPKYMRSYSPDEDPDGDPQQPFLLTAFDAWGNPIRYVHPKFDGIIEQDRRDMGEAGAPVNIVNPNKPFFVEGAIPGDLSRVRLKFIRRNRLVDADYGNEGGGGGGGVGNPTAIDEFELAPDSDGGLTSGGRPYFYSAGPDGDPSTLEDNIYSSAPQHREPKFN